MRLRGGVQPYSGYLEVSYSDEWGFVCDSGSWTMAEANIVCKQLGFGRGIRSTTQGTKMTLNKNISNLIQIICSCLIKIL